MEITEAQYRLIEHCLPTQRGNVSLSNLRVLNAIRLCGRAGLQMARSPQAIRQLAHHLHAHESLVEERRPGSRICPTPEHDQIVRIKIEAVAIDSTAVKVHPDGTGALKKTALEPLASPALGGPPRFIWLPRMLRTAITFALSPGQAHDAPEGRKLLCRLGQAPWPMHLLMDRAYEGDETRQLALDLGFTPVVPPHPNRVSPWQYNHAMYKRRNEIERLSGA